MCFAVTAPALFAAGLTPIPLIGKKPITRQWQDYSEKPVEPEKQAEWIAAHPNANIGLVLGRQAGLCAIDDDGLDLATADRVLAALTIAVPWRRVGKRGFVALVRWREGLKSFQIKAPDGSVLIELLGPGRQVVLPPSIHPDTNQPYTSNCDLLDVLADVPEAPEGLEAKLRAALMAERVAMAAPPGRGRFAVQGPIEAGGRDLAGVSEAGRLAREVVAARLDVPEAISAVEQCHARMKGLDQPDLAKYVGKFFEFLRKDCVVIDAKTGEERLVLPYGWDDALSWTEKVQWGLDQVETAYGERYIARWFVLIAKTGQLVDTRTGEMSEIEVVLRGGVGLYVSYHPRWGQEYTVKQHRGLKRVAYAKMCPGKPPGIIKDGGYDVWNTYRGSAVSAAEGVCDVDVEPFLRLVRMQVPDYADRRHLLDWTAHMFQHPCVRVNHAVVMISEMQGVGKGTVAGCIGDLIHPDHRATTTMDGLESPFNAQYARDKLFVFADELYFKPKSPVPNRLKTLIASDTVTVNDKHEKAYEQDNYARYWSATNDLTALQIDKDDRRYFVIWITDACCIRIQREFDFTAFRGWWANPLNRMKLLGWFLARDLSKFQAKSRPPMTAGKEAVSGLNVPRWEDTLQHALDSEAGPFGKPILTVEAVVAFLEEKKERKTPTYVRHWLRRAGAVPVAERAWVARQGAGGGKLQTTVWAVRDAEHWRTAGMKAVVAELARAGFESRVDQITREAGTIQAKNGIVTHLDTKIGQEMSSDNDLQGGQIEGVDFTGSSYPLKSEGVSTSAAGGPPAVLRH